MFTKLEKTDYPPKDKPLLVWDGQCGFCAYWVARWEKLTSDSIEYRPYQEISDNFPDIDRHVFKQASHLIQTNGKIYSGPGSAYRTLAYAGKWNFLDRFYAKYSWFRKMSDQLYDFIAKHRPAFFKLTKLLFGSDPVQPRPFWVIYLVLILYIIYINT